VKHLIEIPLATGETVIVEVDGAETSAQPLSPRRGIREVIEEQIVDRVEQIFEAALNKVRPAAGAIIEKLQDLSRAPSEIGVEFGIKIGAKGNAFITSADTEANFKVILKWQANK
jgi:NTP-dependent ternary system trypsin peptidase co-occuring protein